MTAAIDNRETGQISIHTENILPIIKKWLYSDKEIFLRELIANGVDAISKLKRIALSEEIYGEPDYLIQVRIDAEKKTLSVIDNGLGMTAEEIKKYINQIAFSGAKEFIERYQGGDENQIIGHFGLGFYSAFMVADRVEIHSRSYQKDAEAAHWNCEGGLDFTLEASDKTERGTEIILHLSEDSAEFLKEDRVRDIIKRYCNFLPVPIQLNGESANDQSPIWAKVPNTLKEEDYKEFYRKHFPGREDPLFWIHLNVDYPFRLQGILFFPKLMHELESSKGEMQLYCNQVYVSDNTQDLVPKFLTVLQGMIDCPDIPLNVSRSMLQNDPYVRKISEHITSKIASRLKALYKSEPKQYETYWENIHIFIKFGAMENEKFYEAIKDNLIFKSTTGEYTTLEAYLERNQEKHKDTVYYYSDADKQSAYLNMFKAQGLEALQLDSMIDTHFAQFLEFRRMPLKFQRIDSDLSETLLDKEAKSRIVTEGGTQDEQLKESIQKLLARENLTIQVESLKAQEVSAVIVQAEYARRFKEMSAFMQRESTGFELPQTLVVNNTNPIVQKLQALIQDGKDEDAKAICEQVYDLARLAHTGLSGEEMTRFLARSHTLLGKL